MKDQMVRVAKEFAADESGVGVVEMILILVVLIGLVIIFKKQLTNLVNSIFETINSKAGRIYQSLGSTMVELAGRRNPDRDYTPIRKLFEKNAD